MTQPPDQAMTPTDQSQTLAVRIYRKRGADLLRYLRNRLRNDADARDIAQEAFLRFIRLNDPERLRNPEAYIFRIAGNLLWEQRLREHEESGQAAQEEASSSEHTPFDVASAGEVADRLRATLSTLPVMQRAVLLLHLRDGLSFSQIATHAGVSSTMAKKHLKNALTACRRRLSDFKIEAGMDS
jgi:RNA polymerase sigma-70 factor (ECF subfamily)